MMVNWLILKSDLCRQQQEGKIMCIQLSGPPSYIQTQHSWLSQELFLHIISISWSRCSLCSKNRACVSCISQLERLMEMHPSMMLPCTSVRSIEYTHNYHYSQYSSRWRGYWQKFAYFVEFYFSKRGQDSFWCISMIQFELSFFEN